VLLVLQKSEFPYCLKSSFLAIENLRKTGVATRLPKKLAIL
jgi:hypothetical protein